MIEETIKTPEEKIDTDQEQVPHQEPVIRSRVVCLDAITQLYSKGEINNLYDRKEEEK